MGLLVIFRLDTPEPDAKQDLRNYLRTAWRGIRQSRALILFIAGFVTFIILFGSFLTFFPLLLDARFGASSTTIGLLMSLMSLTTAVTASQLGRLVTRFTERRLLLTAYVIYTAAMTLMASSFRLELLGLTVVLFGIGHGINLPVIMTLLTGMAPHEYRAAFMSLNGMMIRLGQTFGPVLIGLIVLKGSLSGAFYAGAALSLMVLGLLAFTLRARG